MAERFLLVINTYSYWFSLADLLRNADCVHSYYRWCSITVVEG